ncbi:MAG: molybdopterin-guanine dinucleotide biosynthesis protein MobB [Desulfurococcaceae archaeon]
MAQYVARFVSLRSGAGKTTVASEVVRHLRSRGIVVGVVKHCSSGVVLEEKDSKVYLENGAVAVVASSPGLAVLYISDFIDLVENALALLKTPVVVVEGYKESSVGDAVLVVESNEEARELMKSVKNPVAIVSTGKNVSPVGNLPVFKPSDVVSLSNFIESRAVEQLVERTGKLDCQACGYPSCRSLVVAYLKGKAQWCPVASDVLVRVNGAQVPLNPFVKNIIRSTVLGMLKALKGVPSRAGKVVIEITDQ